MTNFANWVLRRDSFDPNKLAHEETIFTIGNGYLSTRGTFEEGYPGECYATLAHGVFDDIPVVFTELANIPNWTSLVIRLDGERFSLAEGKLLHFERQLDLRTGVLSRFVRWQSRKGQTSEISFERFASLDDPHVLCLRVSVTPLDYSGEVSIRTGLNGSVSNQGYTHWDWQGQAVSEKQAWLSARTCNTGIELGMAMRVGWHGGVDAEYTSWDVDNHPTLVAAGRTKKGETITLEKLTTIYTSRDVKDPRGAAVEKQESLPNPGWDFLFEANRVSWEREWDVCDVVIESDDQAQMSVRFNLYQLLIAAPRQDDQVSIGAKTLSGFGYRGHVFWDNEIFILPFFTFTRPEIARNLLTYRWHRLPGARHKAEENGFQGAQYPWESAGEGDEVTPTWVPDLKDRRKLIRIWTGDIQIHVSADIAYAVWQYWQASGDDEFIIRHGAEIILDTAKFWASRAEWNPEDQRFEFRQVIGPDEYHDHVDNNAFTNYMAHWHLSASLELITWIEKESPATLKDLTARLNLSTRQFENWKHVADHIYLPFDKTSGLIEQFQGYFQQEDIDLTDFEPRTESMQTILGIEGASQTQILKQADVLMLLYLLDDQYDEHVFQANYEYYAPRTDHTYGSSLGPAIHAIVASKIGQTGEAYQHFLRAAYADLFDVRGNAGDGIHAASAGGLWQAVVFGFAGLKFSPQGWTVTPRLPDNWRGLSFKFYHHGKLHQVNIRPDDIETKS